MTAHEWSSKTKTDLVIEVWEKLDCESVGAAELEAIELVVRECFGDNAADPPVVVARQLADEGAVLRHSEILELDVQRRLHSPYDAMFRNLVKFSTLDEAESSLRNLENLRRKLVSEKDREGLRLVKETALKAKDEAKKLASAGSPPTASRYSEIAEWFGIWLQSPEVFENWIKARKSSANFKEEFGIDGE